MSVLILPPLRDDGQKVPCEVGESSVLVLGPVPYKPEIVSPEDIHLEESDEPNKHHVALSDSSFGEIDMGDLINLGNMWEFVWANGQLGCFGLYFGEAKEQIAAYLNNYTRPQQVQLAQARAGERVYAYKSTTMELIELDGEDDGQKVPCEVGESSEVSPQYVVYRRMLDETILYMSPVTRGATHDIDKAKKYPSKGSAQQACRAFGGSCHVLELRPQQVQLAQARAGQRPKKDKMYYCPICEGTTTGHYWDGDDQGHWLCDGCETDLEDPWDTDVDAEVESEAAHPLQYLTPNQLQIISHALGLEGEERNVFYLSPTTLGIMTEVADLVESGYMEFTGVLENGVECYAVTDYGKGLVRPQRVQLAQARAGRKLPPVVTGDAAQDADYVRVRAAREAGCTRPCGNQPNLPVCTRCFENLHAGKWTADEANGNFVFGHGVGWEKVLTVCSQVHGWIKPSGVTRLTELPNG